MERGDDWREMEERIREGLREERGREREKGREREWRRRVNITNTKRTKTHVDVIISPFFAKFIYFDEVDVIVV